MTELIQLFSSLIKLGGIKIVVVIVLAILIVMAGHVTYKFLLKKVESYKVIKESIDQKDLLNHPMFQNLRTYLSYEIQHLVIGERLREAIFRDFLTFKFTSINKEFTHFLKNGDLEKMSNHLYQTRIMECIDNVIRKYEDKASREGMPPIVISKFNEWHSERIKSTYDYLRCICEEEDICNTIKTRLIFNFLIHIVDATIYDAKKTIINLNGQLDGVVYKGVMSERGKKKEC